MGTLDKYSIWKQLEKYNEKMKGMQVEMLPPYQGKIEGVSILDGQLEFTGTLEKFGISTTAYPYLQTSSKDYGQLLIIDTHGDVIFERTATCRSKSDVKRMKISEEDAKSILKRITEHFMVLHKCLIIPDIAHWVAALQNSEGEVFKFMNVMAGSVIFEEDDADFDAKKKYYLELKETTKLIKSILNDNAIYAFGDGLPIFTRRS